MKIPKILRKKQLSSDDVQERMLETAFRHLKANDHFHQFINSYLLIKREQYIRTLHTIADPHVKQEIAGKVSALDEILEEITEDYFQRKINEK